MIHRYNFLIFIPPLSSSNLQEAAYDYMVKEGERMFLECLDQLEVARAKLEDVSQTCFTSSVTSFTASQTCLSAAGTEDWL